MEKLIWVLAISVWVLFIGTVIKDYLQTQSNKREALLRDMEYRLKAQADTQAKGDS